MYDGYSSPHPVDAFHAFHGGTFPFGHSHLEFWEYTEFTKEATVANNNNA